MFKSLKASYQNLTGRKKAWYLGSFALAAMAGVSLLTYHYWHKSQLQAQEVSALAEAEDQDGDEDSDEAEAEAAKPKALVIEKAAAPAVPEARPGFYGVVHQAFENMQATVKEIATAEQDNERLRLENANLRLKIEAFQFGCHAKDAAETTAKISQKLAQDTGSKVGRTLANISYRPPTHLLRPQLYTLAVTYFKAQEDEKAAVLFSMLTGFSDSETYKTPKNYLMMAVAWYRLDNFELASSSLEKVITAPEDTANMEILQLKAQARLWKGLVAERLGKHGESQASLKELIDHHPHSMEAAWVNSKEAKRAVASDE